MVDTCFQRQLALLVTLLTGFGVVGCEPGRKATYPVSGKVVFADGSPLITGGIVLFESIAAEGQSVIARGVVQDDGTFRLSTFEEGDGARAGKYRILVRAKRDATDYRERGIIPRPVIDSRYENYETSGLQFTVEENNNEFKVVVNRPMGPG